MDRDFPPLASPVAMGQAAGKRASLSWKVLVSSRLLKRNYYSTCEVVEPPTRSFVAFTFVSTDWIVAAAFLTPHIAARGAPFEFSRRLCRIRTEAACCSVAGFLKRHLCSVIVGFLLLKRHLAISGAVPRGTERGSQGRAASSTACSQSTAGDLDCVVWVAASDSHRFVEEGEDIVKEINGTCVCVS